MANFEVGDEIFVYDDPKKEKQWREGIAKVKEDIKELPEGGKHITFYMTDSYMRNFSPNTKIPYKHTIKKIRLKDGVPELKDHNITIRQGRIKTSNAEEIAFLDMKSGFVRARDRKLTAREADKARIDELEEKVKKLMAVEEVKEPEEEKPSKPKTRPMRKARPRKVKSYASPETKG